MPGPLAGKVVLVAGATRGAGRGRLDVPPLIREPGGLVVEMTDGTREYGFTDVDGSQPDCRRYLVEVQDPGLPPDPTGYR